MLRSSSLPLAVSSGVGSGGCRDRRAAMEEIGKISVEIEGLGGF